MLLAAALLLGAAAGRRSGYDDATPAVRAMQDDDTANPAMLWVQQGQALWDQSCAACHGKVEAMRGVAARYPFYDRAADRVVTLEQRITSHQGGPAFAPESDELLGLTALLGLQSRGLPVSVNTEGAEAVLAQGEALFTRRMGQLNLSCVQCHDTLAGQRLGGARIPQAHPTAYPLYRLEWQSMGSLYRRLRNCLTGVRSEPFARGSPELGALEFYLAWRANGMRVETPGVRP